MDVRRRRVVHARATRRTRMRTPARYTITLTATSEAGGTDRASHEVTVAP